MHKQQLTDLNLKLKIGDLATFEHGYGYWVDSGYVLTLSVRGLSTLDKVCGRDTVQFLSSETATLAKGWHILILSATLGSERTELLSRRLEVVPDRLNDPEVTDYISHNQKMLNSLTAFIEGRAEDGQIDHVKSMIGDKELWQTPMAEIIKIRDTYHNKVKMENGTFKKKIKFWFK